LSNRHSLYWRPVVFTFSFTSKEMQTQPFAALKDRFEQLDIKLLPDYNAHQTTHVVSKKRNTAKGLQALINAKHIVTDTFLDAVVAATDEPEIADGLPGPSALEQDVKNNWPNEIDHLPPRGGEPVQHPDEIYAPDSRRAGIFDGYTFIFYEPSQFNTLLAPVANGGGKALLHEVAPEQTVVDDFIRYVKSVAGEKGLGSFEDGSEGKGVVLVRHTPSKGAHVQWYADFFTEVSLRLDHRPIEQSEFLEAILIKDATILRRPLEIESAPNTQEPPRRTRARQPETSASNGNPVSQEVEEVTDEPPPPKPAPRRGRTQRSVKRRFAGFDEGSDIEMDSAPAPLPIPAQVAAANLEDESGLFVSQNADDSQPTEDSASTRSQRKRTAPPEDGLMEGMTTAVTRFKKQRIALGDAFAQDTPEPEAEQEEEAPKTKKKVKKELDILAVAARNREKEEARARAEKEDLAQLPGDVDLAEIRRLNIVEEMEIRQPAGAGRTREQDIADGRWNPAWNGMKNFKKFRQRGETYGRQAPRTIVPLTEVKSKEFGVGDDYWLEDNDSQRQKKTQSQPSVDILHPEAPASRTRASRVVESESDDVIDEESEGGELETVSQIAAKAGRRRGAAKDTSQESSARTSQRQAQSQKRRPAPEPAREQPAKRPRPARKAIEIPDSEGSDDDLKFKFGKRR
jgi:hypothetical protein